MPTLLINLVRNRHGSRHRGVALDGQELGVFHTVYRQNHAVDSIGHRLSEGEGEPRGSRTGPGLGARPAGAAPAGATAAGAAPAGARAAALEAVRLRVETGKQPGQAVQPG